MIQIQRVLRPAMLSLSVATLLWTVPTHAAAQRGGTELFAETFRASGTTTIDVDVSDADLRIESHDGEGLEVRVTGHGDSEDARELFQAMDFDASMSSGNLRVEASDPNMGRDWWRSGRRAEITVWISAPSASPLQIRTSDGDIEVGDFDAGASLRSSDGDIVAGQINGDVEIHTSDGDILARRISGSIARIRTSDGDVSIESLASEEATLQSSDGDVDVAFRGGYLEARSSDGDLTVEVLDDADVSLRTGDGDIEIWVPAGYGADVVLEGEDLDVDQDVQLRGRVSDERITGTLNEGGSRLEASTGDGSVTLRTRGRQVR